MTLAHARKLVVDGEPVQYVLKYGRHSRYRGQSNGSIRLVVQIGKKYVARTFLSKHWTEEHSNGDYWASEHKVAFKPSDVCLVVRTLKASEYRLPEGFDLPDWVPYKGR